MYLNHIAPSIPKRCICVHAEAWKICWNRSVKQLARRNPRYGPPLNQQILPCHDTHRFFFNANRTHHRPILKGNVSFIFLCPFHHFESKKPYDPSSSWTFQRRNHLDVKIILLELLGLIDKVCRQVVLFLNADRSQRNKQELRLDYKQLVIQKHLF